MQISEAFDVVAELALALGVRNIGSLPGLWTCDIDEHWRVSLNGHKEEIDKVPPYHCAVEWNGFPAGLFSPAGGIIAAGAVANEQAFIEACKARLKMVKGDHD
jgi:hypothetical protein